MSSQMSAPAFTLDITGLCKAFGRHVICHDALIRLSTGESLAIVGPNGSGKSTLVKLIAGLLRPDAGAVTYSRHGTPIPATERYRYLGLVSPDLALYEELTGLENLEFANRVGAWGKTPGDSQAMLDEIGLSDRGSDMVSTYSSGMKQRLKYAAAFLKDPALLLLDEPTANLDEEGSDRVWSSLARRNLALIIATNDPEEAQRAQSCFVAGQ